MTARNGITLLPAPVYMCGFWSSFGRSKFTIVKCGEILRCCCQSCSKIRTSGSRVGRN